MEPHRIRPVQFTIVDPPDEATVTHRRHARMVTSEEKDQMGRAFESLDFTMTDNVMWRKHQAQSTTVSRLVKTLGKWVVAFLIGISVGLIVYVIKTSVEHITELKFRLVNYFLAVNSGLTTTAAFFLYLGSNLTLAVASCVVVILTGPLTSSSGIPEVKGYLNGIRVTKAFNVLTLLGKVVSLILSFSSGLALGPEGPMFHIGSIVGAALSQMKSKTFNVYSKVFWRYQNDRDKRDFISCGAAAGIAAAFGAPIGGVLFALEEGLSFWSKTLCWRTFLSCLVATFTANLFLQGFSSAGVRDYGVVNFGLSSKNLYKYFELLPFAMLGIVGGLGGALFVHINVRINKWRMDRLGTRPFIRLVEIVILVLITTLITFITPMFFSCRSVGDILKDHEVYDLQEVVTEPFLCGDDQYNDMATLLFTTPERALHALYSRSHNIFSGPSMFVFAVSYFTLTVVTSGAYVASGVFIPMMLVGGALGRLTGTLMSNLLSDVDNSIYALLGSAAFMAGSLRMTIALVIIMVELTEGTQYLLPIILVVMLAKWAGDLFNESIYEHLIEIKRIPYLQTHPARIHGIHEMSVSDAMAQPVTSVSPVMAVKDVVSLLKANNHNGFPVVYDRHRPVGADETGEPSDPILTGLILRNQILVLLHNRVFGLLEDFPAAGVPPARVPLHRQPLGEPRCGKHLTHIELSAMLAQGPPPIQSITLTSFDMDMIVDFRPYMNFSPVTCSPWTSFGEAYELFRALALRHLVVVDESHHVVGMITRKDLL